MSEEAKVDRDSWSTPDYIFEPLDREFDFQIDVCASEDNAKVPGFYFTERDDALTRKWRVGFGLPPMNIWCNPPYSGPAEWVKYAISEAEDTGNTMIVLTNNILDRKYFREFLPNIAEIRIGLRRIQFDVPEGVKASTNPYSQMLSIITPESANTFSTPKLKLWDIPSKPKKGKK